MFPVHGDPDDYWRPTPSALGTYLHDSEFEGIEISTLGVGKAKVRAQVAHGHQILKIQRLASWYGALASDAITNSIDRNGFAEKNSKFFLGLAFRAQKK